MPCAALRGAGPRRSDDRATWIVDDRGREADLARLHVHLDCGGLRAERPGDGVGIEVGARVEAGLAGRLERLRLYRGMRDASRLTARSGIPTTWTRLVSMTVLGRALEQPAATRSARARDSRAVCATAGPELRRRGRRCPCRTGRARCRPPRPGRLPRRRRARRRRSGRAWSRGPAPAPSRRCRRRPCRLGPRAPSRSSYGPSPVLVSRRGPRRFGARRRPATSSPPAPFVRAKERALEGGGKSPGSYVTGTPSL